MDYSISLISKIKSTLYARISNELDRAIENNELDLFMDHYDVIIEEEKPYVSKQMKILVFGQLAGKIKDYELAAKKEGINKQNLEFVNDYNDTKKYNVARLENSFEYSDIIAGPMPHMIKGLEGDNSFIANVTKNPGLYPRLISATNSNELKLSINSFRRALRRTRYFENLNSNL